MPAGISCPVCRTPLPADSAYCPKCDEFVEVDARGKTLPDTRIASRQLPAIPIPTQDEAADPYGSISISRNIGQEIPLRFFAFDDPNEVWDGTLSLHGLGLTHVKEDRQSFIPFGTDVQWNQEGRLKYSIDGHEVRLTLISGSIDRASAARDLASFLRCERTEFDTSNYQLPRVMPWLFFLVAFGSIVCTFYYKIFFALDFGCILPGYLLGAFPYVAWRTGTSWPKSVIVVSILLAIPANVASFGILVYRQGHLDYVLPGPDTIAPADWRTFAPPEEDYQIELPAKPTTRFTRLKEDNHGIVVHSVILIDSSYVVGVVQGNKPVKAESRLDFHRKLVLQNPAKPRFVSEEKITYQGFEGIEIVTQVPSISNSVTRIIVTNDRVYMLEAVGLGYTSDSPNVVRFFSSLQIK